MRSSKTSLPLEDSWGIVNSDTDQGDTQEEDLFDKRMRAQRRKTPRRTTQEPEFIMPSIGNNAMDGSRLGSRPFSPTSNDGSETPAAVRSRHRSTRLASAPESPKRRPKRRLEKQTVSDQHPSQQARQISTSAILNWFFDIIADMFNILRYPITYGAAIWLFLGIMMLAQNFFLYSVERALSPVCRIPGLSSLAFCPTLPTQESRDGVPVAFDEVVAAQSNFEDLIEATTTHGNLQLPREMKSGERLIRDLRGLISMSQVNSKWELLLEFDRYINTSMHTIEGLTRFNSHIGLAVDNILYMSRHTLHLLDDLEFKAQEPHPGVIAFIFDKILAPFQPIKFTEDRLFDQFIVYTKTMEDEITTLLEEAENLQWQLNFMEGVTDLIGRVVVQDREYAAAKKEEIYSWLWTRLGGNRNRVHQIHSDINLLKKVNFDRKAAALHVSTTILRLLDTKVQLENLRSRLAQPDLARDTLPLSVHIDTILAGAQRLEAARSDSRDRETVFHRGLRNKEGQLVLELPEGGSQAR